MFASLFQIRRQHIFDPFHECADSTRQIAPVCYDEGHGERPLWEPGTAPGYHTYTFGFLIGEVVRRICGTSLGVVFREEIAKPLGADFWIGLPESEDHRVAELIPFELPPAAAGTVLTDIQSITLSNTRTDVEQTMTREWRAAEIPSVNGHGNAQSIAEIHALLANGGALHGKRIMSERGCRKAQEEQVRGPDLVMMGREVRFGLGFGLAPCPIFPMRPQNANTMFWSGGGSSLIVIDTEARTTFAYAMNRMRPSIIGDERSHRLIEAIWEAMTQ